MKKITLTALGIILLIVIAVALAGMYKFNYLASQPGYDADGNKIENPAENDSPKENSDPQNTTYYIEGEEVTLIDGSSETKITPNSASKITTKYFGNEIRSDLDDDGREDVVFLLTQETGGSGTFFYVVAALNTEEGWKGSHGLLLGDRISPQSTEISQKPNHKNVIVVNYADRSEDQSMIENPSVGKSIWLKLDPESMMFGEVAQNFPGEANPDVMTLDMKTWTWVKTSYNNDTEITPNQSEAFTLTFTNEGMVSATTDCNAMSGAYSTEGNQITFGPVAMTKKFCPDSQEQYFAKTLSETQSFFFTSKGELVFDLKFDSGSAVFK